MFNAGKNLVARSIKHYGLIDSLREPEDYKAMLQVLHEAHQFYKNIGDYNSSDHLRKKVWN